jgi:multidrug efflux pump subunit AcrB
MLQLVKLALSKPYTFVVLAILIVLSGSIAWVRTPTDIFPDIRIPVIAAVWTYRGLPPEDMSGRVVYYYERQLSTTVNDIDHIESQSLNGIGVVKIFFRPAWISARRRRRSRRCRRRCSSRCRRASPRR